MKKGFVLGVSLLLALPAGSAVAEILTVRVMAHVVQLDDPENVLGGQVSVGQTVQGSYTYETTAADRAPWDTTWGSYVQTPEQGHTNFVIGSHVFETDPASPDYWMYHVQVYGSPEAGNPDSITIASQNNKLLSNGATVSILTIDFSDFSGTALSSDQLPVGAPDLNSFGSRSIYISGSDPSLTNGWYNVMLEIDALEVAPALQLSPASSRFVRTQHINAAAFVKSTGVAISNLRGNINGAALPASYVDQCLQVSNNQNRGVISCPDIIPLLANGINNVEMTVDLPDGSSISADADWEIIE